jgi:uncharacterized cupin superfamily protein
MGTPRAPRFWSFVRRLGCICKDRPVLRANVLRVDCDYDETDPAGYRSGQANISQTLGAEALAAKVYGLPIGESVCPYHYEYEEEWLLVLLGAVVVRLPAGEQELACGEMTCFPPGPSGAHKVTNRGETMARIMMFSSAREPAVAVYPDSNKIGVWPGNPGDKVMLRRADGDVDYWDGER